MSQETGCEFCNKRGLPILPLRYAPATAGCGAPHAEPGVGIPMPAAIGQYTRRLLRDGYLYVYDEANNQWDDYWVTEDSYFFRLPQGQKQNIRLPRKFNCHTESHRAMASFITIYKNKKTSNIWLAFSDVRWTDAVRARHQKTSYRRLHMRCVNIHAYDSSPDFQHCFAINRISEQVAEYKQTRHELFNSTGFSPYISEKRLHMKKDLLAACEQLAPGKGLAVVLDDPVGIVTDLASMPTPLIEEFNKKNDRKRALNTSIHIDQIKMAILLRDDQENAKNPPRRKKSAEEQKEIVMELKRIGSSIDFFKIPKSEAEIPDRIKNFKYNKPQINDYKNHREITKKDPWQKYRMQFNEKEMHSWRDTYEKEYSEFDKKTISPLAKTHSTWMQSKSVKNYLACNFDRTDPNSGLIYTRVIHACIAGTQDKAPCFCLYEKWFNIETNKSPLLRALTLNMDSIATAIKNITENHNINFTSIPLNILIDALKAATKNITGNKENALTSIIMEISAILVKAANTNEKKIHPGFLALSMITEKLIIPIEVLGKKVDFYTALIKNTIRENLKSINIKATEAQINNMTSIKLKQLEAAGIPMENMEKKTLFNHGRSRSNKRNAKRIE